MLLPYWERYQLWLATVVFRQSLEIASDVIVGAIAIAPALLAAFPRSVWAWLVSAVLLLTAAALFDSGGKGWYASDDSQEDDLF